jgi:hypothetical protein
VQGQAGPAKKWFLLSLKLIFTQVRQLTPPGKKIRPNSGQAQASIFFYVNVINLFRLNTGLLFWGYKTPKPK